MLLFRNMQRSLAPPARKYLGEMVNGGGEDLSILFGAWEEADRYRQLDISGTALGSIELCPAT